MFEGVKSQKTLLLQELCFTQLRSRRAVKTVICTCLLRTGCCSPSKSRRTPSYLASSPIHFPKTSKNKIKQTGKH